MYAVDAATGEERQITHAAIGERYYIVHAYGDWFLTTHAVSMGDSKGDVTSWDGRIAAQQFGSGNRVR